MENTKYMDLIGRYLSGDITAGEKAGLMAWVEADSGNKAFFDEMIRLWSVSREYEEQPFLTDTDAAWANFEQKFARRFPASPGSALPEKAAEEAKVIPMRPLRLALRYAAAIALLLAAGYWFLARDGGSSSQMASFHTGPGEQRELLLPDGSAVVLNENSEIAYPASFEERRVKLSGEAFFQVARLNGQTFTIDAEGATTTVLGTSFNVRAYPAEEMVEVSVQSGKVALRKAEDRKDGLILEAGQSGIYDKKKDEVDEVAISNADSWKTGRLDFRSIPLEAVAGAVERYFDVDIEVANPKLLKCHFWGEYPQPKLEEILEALSFTMDLRVEKQGSRYVLDGDASRCK